MRIILPAKHTWPDNIQPGYKKEKKIKEKSDKAQLINYYNPIIGWDSTEVFTSWYQENLYGEQKKIAFEGIIKDIVKVDSVNYVARIYKQRIGYNNAALLIDCQISQAQKVKIENESKEYKGFFIIKIEKVESHFPELESEYEHDFNMNRYNVSFDFDVKLVVLKGFLIDFRLYEE